MKRKKYFLLAGSLLLVVLMTSTSPAQTCKEAFETLEDQCTSASPPVMNYIKNYIPELYEGPYKKMWWYNKLLNPAQDWEVATVKFFDHLPGSVLPDGTIFEQNVPVEMSDGLFG